MSLIALKQINFNFVDVDFISGYLGSTGLDSGTINQKVDGSTINQEFYIESDASKDIYINKIQYIFVCSIPRPKQFAGDNNPLTNGLDLTYNVGNGDKYIIKDAKINSDLIEQTGAENYLDESHGTIENWTSNYDALIITVSFIDLMNKPLKLEAGQSHNIKAIVKDDLTALTDIKLNELKIRVFGGIVR